MVCWGERWKNHTMKMPQLNKSDLGRSKSEEKVLAGKLEVEATVPWAVPDRSPWLLSQSDLAQKTYGLFATPAEVPAIMLPKTRSDLVDWLCQR